MSKIALINHGCAKNLVDSELMLGMLINAGFEVSLNEDEADIVIINTCSFIHDAEKESVQSILNIVNKGKKVIVTGCLPQKHKMQLKEAIPEIVAMIGTTDFNKLVKIVKGIESQEEKFVCEIAEKPQYLYPEMLERQQITTGASSYIKIADGCNSICGYCIIPQLRGKYKSRPIVNIVNEAKKLGEKGVNEIILIAQDVTSYGTDLYSKPALIKLLEKLNETGDYEWIRLLYAYPSMLNNELLDVIANLEKVVKYIDIPLQHSHPDILKSMRRPALDYEELIKKIREKIPNVAIRTAFIVGYPGETTEHFEHLCNFVKKMRFDKMGVFEFSREQNTYAYDLAHQIPSKIKKERKETLMLIQQEISKQINQELIGKKIPCIVEAINQEGIIIARSYKDAPEIDGLVYIKSDKQLLPGDIELIEITHADEYDLHGYF